MLLFCVKMRCIQLNKYCVAKEKNTIYIQLYTLHFDVVVVVVLLLYVHGKHLMSCRDGQLT